MTDDEAGVLALGYRGRRRDRERPPVRRCATPRALVASVGRGHHRAAVGRRARGGTATRRGAGQDPCGRRLRRDRPAAWRHPRHRGRRRRCRANGSSANASTRRRHSSATPSAVATTIAIDDIHQSPHWPNNSAALDDFGPLIIVPLVGGGGRYGVLWVGNRIGGRQFRDTQQAMLEAFADQAALGLELARQRRETEQLSLFRDRDRIARDLHDTVIQRLFATGMQLEGSMRYMTSPEASERVQGAVSDLDKTIKEIRSTIYALQRSDRTPSSSLRARIVELLEELAPTLGFTPAFGSKASSTHRCRKKSARTCCRSCAKRLSNIARHAHARHADVSVVVDDAWVTRHRHRRRRGVGRLAAAAAGWPTLTPVPAASTGRSPRTRRPKAAPNSSGACPSATTRSRPRGRPRLTQGCVDRRSARRAAADSSRLASAPRPLYRVRGGGQARRDRARVRTRPVTTTLQPERVGDRNVVNLERHDVPGCVRGQPRSSTGAHDDVERRRRRS